MNIKIVYTLNDIVDIRLDEANIKYIKDLLTKAGVKKVDDFTVDIIFNEKFNFVKSIIDTRLSNIKFKGYKTKEEKILMGRLKNLFDYIEKEKQNV
jgi:hypothetical protein